MTATTVGAVVYEPDHTGHHLYYVRLLAELVREQGHHLVLVTTTVARASAEFEQHLGPRVADGTIHPDVADEDRAEGCRRALALARARSTGIIVMEADDLLPTLLRAVATRRAPDSVAALIMRTAPVTATAASRARFFAKRALATLLRRSRAVRLLRLAPQLGTPETHRLPGDPITDPTPALHFDADMTKARSYLELPHDVPVVTMVGLLSEWKAVDVAVDAVASLGPSGPTLVLAGAASAWVHATVASPAGQRLQAEGRLVFRPGYVTDEELDAYVVGTDVLLLLYRYDASSGLLGRAAQARCQILTGGSAILTQQVHAYGLGGSTNMRAEDVASALVGLLAQGPREALLDCVRAVESERAFAAKLLGQPAASRTT